jgi:hypothetical protein
MNNNNKFESKIYCIKMDEIDQVALESTTIGVEKKIPEKQINRGSDHDQISNGKLKLLIVIIIIASLVWGFVGSVELLILSAVQTLFPTRTNLQYAIMQIVIYLILLFLIIYITNFDASSLFIFNSPSNRIKF